MNFKKCSIRWLSKTFRENARFKKQNNVCGTKCVHNDVYNGGCWFKCNLDGVAIYDGKCGAYEPKKGD